MARGAQYGRCSQTTLHCRGYTMPNGKKQFSVKMPATMWVQLKALAIDEKTSMNKKIVRYIEAGLKDDLP
jgi:hypothetical protein